MSLSSRFLNPTLREVSNVNILTNLDLKDVRKPAVSAPDSSRMVSGWRAPPLTRLSNPPSPRRNNLRTAHSDMIADVADMFLLREKQITKNANYLSQQSEVNEKMRMILVDWLVDVHLKFKLHEETLFLAVDLLDRYLAVAKTSRTQLQLVGVTCILLAAKYEEIWPPEIKDCIHISANTYNREELLRLERAICTALQFKLTTPTPFPFLTRLLDVCEADENTRNTAFYYLETAMLDYKHLQFYPSQIANAALYLANVSLRKPDPWSSTLVHHSKSSVNDFRSCMEELRQFAEFNVTTKYQAIKRKYSTPKFGEVASRVSHVPFEL